MSRSFITTLLIMGLCVLVTAGCSGSGSPMAPDMSGSGINGERTVSADSSRNLWGIWHVTINPETLTAEIEPVRGAMFTANVTRFMQPPSSPVNMISFGINTSSEPENGYFIVDVILRHPFPGINFYNGFDVRGIFMSNGSVNGTYDPTVMMAGVEDSHLLNPDGYTRFWNWEEFTSYETILGATQGRMAPPVHPNTTVNPYKYFCDDLDSLDPVENMDHERRGFFSTAGVNSREYEIQFRMDPGPVLDFNYAVDASWAEPDDGYAPDFPPEAFPVDANCAEAYHLAFRDAGSTAYYVDETDNGGYLLFDLEIWDHQGAVNPSGVAGEISAIWLEGNVLASPVNVLDTATVLPGNTVASSVFEVMIDTPLLTKSGVSGIFATVESAWPDTYEPQIDGGEFFDYPDAPLAAYFTFDVNVAGIPGFLTVITPNGGEIYTTGSDEEITWNPGGVTGNVLIEYSKDDFAADFHTIEADTENDGYYLWDGVPYDPSETVKVRISSIVDPVINDESDDYFTIEGVGPPTTPVMIDPDVDTYGVTFAIASDGIIHTIYHDTLRENVYWSYSDTLGNTWTNEDDPIYSVDTGATPARMVLTTGLAMDADDDYVYCLISEYDGVNTSQFCKMTGGRLDISDLSSGWEMITVWNSPMNGDGRNNFGRPQISVADDGGICITALYYYGYGGYFDPSYSYVTGWSTLSNAARYEISPGNGYITYIYPRSTVCLINDGSYFYYATGGLMNDYTPGYGTGIANALLKFDPSGGGWSFIQFRKVPNQSNSYQRNWPRGITFDSAGNINWVFGYIYNNTGDNNYGSNYGDYELGYAVGAASGDHDFTYTDPITETYHHRHLDPPGYEDAVLDYFFCQSSIGTDSEDNVFICYQSAEHERIIYGIKDEGSGWTDPVEIDGDEFYGMYPYGRMHDPTGYMMISFTDLDYPSGGTGKPHFVAWK